MIVSNQWGTRQCIRSSLIHCAYIGVAPPRLFTPQEQSTPMQAKWFKLDLAMHINIEHTDELFIPMHYDKCINN